MTPRATISQADLIRIAKAAKATGYRIEVKRGDMTITFMPDGEGEPDPKTGFINGIDYSRPVF